MDLPRPANISAPLSSSFFLTCSESDFETIPQMMSGTYEEVSEKAGRQLMIDRYYMVKEHQRWALAMPPFFNLIFIAYEMGMFFWYYRVLREKHDEGGFWDLLDGYLSRNNSDFVSPDVRYNSSFATSLVNALSPTLSLSFAMTQFRRVLILTRNDGHGCLQRHRGRQL